mmetsp:Transcript_8059/g.15180  ORF Transcript_8059/g.15180 Transcript_8059/m.15180 type:complete len:130 (+) Transcript_8059:160-549(+)|eukprot:CAMPEP_0176489296 /NCGR_PEP_ID=MMETSP0200_2-20121128/7203_1 /TAXON_ID=947934 /ORGANISM="Chaetoceros sp., Strain GSL56" /LENGTH=129 /DNA_ID=CAMNT_0017886409 /DNA_START=129 /DNA_END=518 /DNA_ORIENTATION=+
MNKSIFSLFFLITVVATVANGFSVGSVNGGSSFATAQRFTAMRPTTTSAPKGDMQMMGGKKAKFGIFSPAVYVAKIALGEAKLNKFRGKAISLHSQVIGDFTEWAGAYHLRTKLIKLAKTNGDTLGFLV